MTRSYSCNYNIFKIFTYEDAVYTARTFSNSVLLLIHNFRCNIYVVNARSKIHACYTVVLGRGTPGHARLKPLQNVVAISCTGPLRHSA